MGLIEAIILAIIEGLTEYIPVSSTGHMIIASTFMGIQAEPFVKLFTVCIQLGAIMAVVILYYKNFFKSVHFYYKLFIAFVPAVVLGVLLKSTIDRMLESVLVVAVSLIAGGIVLVFIDRIYHPGRAKTEGKITYKNAFVIGLFQTISMIPGVSRSAASIIGGMSQGLTRKAAAEFSFFLAVPTMFGATAKSMFDYFDDGGTILPEQWKILIAGNVVALIVSIIAIRFMMNVLNTFGFRYFGYYRIAAGAFILILYFTGTNMVLID